MTDLGSLRAETEALATCGRERCEDAVVFHVMNGFIRDVLNVEPTAFGEFPDFSQAYYEMWTQLKDARTDECSIVRDQLWKQGVNLIRIAAEYEETDIEAALEFDKISEEIDTYVTANEHAFTTPGTGLSGDFIADNPSCPNTGPGTLDPSTSGALSEVFGDAMPSYQIGPVETKWIPLPTKYGAPGIQVGYYEATRSVTLDPGCERDTLHRVLSENLETIAKADAFFEVLSIADAKPLSEMIVHAYRSSPTIIRARASMMYQVAAAIDLLAEEMRAEVFNLQSQWWGTSGSSSDQDVGTGAPAAYYVMADTTMRYLGTMAKICRWQAKRGVDLADILTNVRGGYANAIIERVADLADAIAAYASAGANLSAGSETDLAGSIQDFVGALRTHTEGNLNLLREYLKIDVERWAMEAEFDGEEAEFIDPRPFPFISGGDSWMTPGDWKPKEDHPTEYINPGE